MTRTKTSCTVRKSRKRKTAGADYSQKKVAVPDPDCFYTRGDVPDTVSDDELFVHTREVIRRKVERNKLRSLARLSNATKDGQSSPEKKRKSLPLQFSGSDTEDPDRDAPSHCLAGSVAKQGLVKEYADPLYTGYEPSKSKGVQTTPIQSVPVGYKSYDEWYHSPFLSHRCTRCAMYRSLWKTALRHVMLRGSDARSFIDMVNRPEGR